MHLSTEARQYKWNVTLLLLEQRVEKISQPIAVSLKIDWYRARRRGDLDKRLGILIDAMQGVLIDNDSQIVEILARRFEDKLRPRIELELSQLSMMHEVNHQSR